MRPMARYMPGLQINEVLGGTDIHDQIRMLREDGSQVLVATPGRMWDLYQRHAVDFSHIRFFIVEALDEILTHGFTLRQIADYVRVMPENAQLAVIASSLTSTDVDRFVTHCLSPEKTVRIIWRDRTLTLHRTRHFYIDVSSPPYDVIRQQQEPLNSIGEETHETTEHIEGDTERDEEVEEEKRRYLAFEDFLDTYSMPAHVLIYCANQARVDWLTSFMKGSCFPVVSIDNEQSQEARDAIIKQFKNGFHRYLVTTDLHQSVFPDCVVINYDWPRYREQYLRRAGRIIYRNERFSACVNFISMKNESERKLMQSISDLYDVTFEEMPADEDAVMGGF
jgi:superfamily II DNA/RNA helicase